MPSREGDCPANLKNNLELETVLPPLPRSGSVQQTGCSEPRDRVAVCSRLSLARGHWSGAL